MIIADVSGHGLSSGLRMAMLKAALLILVEETREPEEILAPPRRRGALEPRDAASSSPPPSASSTCAPAPCDLTNAGHPPTYRLRGAEVEEILLPSSPLGGLGHAYGQGDAAARAAATPWSGSPTA